MNRPMTSYPCCLSRYAATELSTPPLIANTTRADIAPPFSLSSYVCSIEGACRQSNACPTALSRSRILEISLAVSVFGFRGGASGEDRHDIGVQIIRDMRAVMPAVV